MANYEAPEPDNSVTPPAADAQPMDDSQLPWRVWVSRNGFFLAMLAVCVGALYYWFGGEGLWNIVLAGLGLGFVIFFHELGHFAVAKWCDVHVQTFSIGFGPALPGCRFQKGETTYKLALIPLGGYVKMVGEGSEGEEGDDDPRSFRNKTVGQRMAIISAGVVMNVILGCICFIVAYKGGVKQGVAVIAAVEPGSPAWKNGSRTADLIEQIGETKNPTYEDFKFGVMLSSKGERLPITLAQPDRPPRQLSIEPRRNEHDATPVIGVYPAPELKLAPEREFKRAKMPVTTGPTAAARALPINSGDRIIATSSDPDKQQEITPMPPGPNDYQELARRLERLVGKPFVMEVRRAGAPDQATTERLEVPPDNGFQPGDTIVGTTEVGEAPFDPFRVAKLPIDEFRSPQRHLPDYFEYRRRLQHLGGRPVVIQVERDHPDGTTSSAPVSLFVPPTYHYTFGMRMAMGRITAVRDDSPAQKAGIQPNDVLKELELTDGRGDKVRFVNPAGKAPHPTLSPAPSGGEGRVRGSNGAERVLDPVRLSFDLRQWVGARTGVKVLLTVLRDQHHDMDKPTTLPEVTWDESWRFNQELPFTTRSPISIPELGIAYLVKTTVEDVAADSPAQSAGIRRGDVILTIFSKKGVKKNGTPDWEPLELWTEQKTEPDKKHPEDWWAHVLWAYQPIKYHEVKFLIRREVEGEPGKFVEQEEELTGLPDRTWPLDEPNLPLELAWRMQKAESIGQALAMGAHRTVRSIVQVYQNLKGMITQRISPTKTLRGPISIAHMAYAIAGEDLATFVLFLGMISVNLAVVNFLPIPVLDGGHMVFLIYEKVRGKPASEHLRVAATYVGLGLILLLMGFVIYLDVKRHWL